MFKTMKQAYSKKALGHSAVFKWHKCFAQGRDSLDDDEHTSQPRTVRTELKIQEVLVHASLSQMVGEIAAAGMSHGTCHKILTDDLNMLSVSEHCVPHILTQDKRDERMSICGDTINSADKDGMFFNQIIIGDKTCCFLYDLQLKRH
jgi:hypothetical protein